MIQETMHTPNQETILRQVNQVRRSKQIRDRRYSWLVGAAVLAIMMLVAMIVESQLNLFSYTLRFSLSFLSLVAAILCTWTLWKRGTHSNERLVTAAKDIDATYPAYQQRVSTLMSCHEDRLESKNLFHPAMLNRLTEETLTVHQGVESKPIVTYRMLKLPMACLALAAVTLLGMFAWDTPKTLVQLGRFFAPWSNLSTTKVTAVEADHVVARHEMFKLTASLSGRPVDEVAFISNRLDSANPSTTRLWPSKNDSSVARLRPSKALESFNYRFRAGDGQTDWHRVTVADRPKIEDLTMRIVPPAYTGKPTQTFQRLPKKLRVVAGSRLEVAVKPKTSVRTARLVMGKTDWISMALSPSGFYDGSLELRQPIKVEVQLTELHGLVNRRAPECFLQVVPDQVPKIKIVKPTKTAVLLPDEAIDIHFVATDDFGVQEMALRVTTQQADDLEAKVHEVPIPIAPNTDRRRIKGVVQLDLAQFDLKNGDKIRYEIRVRDNFQPLQDASQQTGLHPMKDVEMVQAVSPQKKNDATTRKESPGLPDPKSMKGETTKPSSPSSAIGKSASSTQKKNPTNANQPPSSTSHANATSHASAPSHANAPSSQTSSSQRSTSSTKPASEKTASTEMQRSRPELIDKEPTKPASDPVRMAMRSLDVGGQSSSSGQQQIKVDQYAGGFNSDDRQKLELAISPTLDLLRNSLTSAGKSVKSVMSGPTVDQSAELAFTSASDKLKAASEAVILLKEKTKNTPYAFVGLRLESIRSADVAPAWSEIQKAINTHDEARLQHARTVWNHISRALATLAKIDEQFDQVKRNLKRADDILKFKKMHRVFIENTLAMLDPESFSLNGQNRKGAEFDLDEEYLKRLKEVLQMQQDMMAELARILADDPKLLRRYMNRMNQRTWSIRDQLTLLASEQRQLSRQVSQWSAAADQPDELANHLNNATELHLIEVEKLANELADVRNEFLSWLPLKEDAEKNEFADLVTHFRSTGSALTEVVADVETMILDGTWGSDASGKLEPLLSKAILVEKQLDNVAQALRRLNRSSTQPEVVNNTARRLPELEKVQQGLQRWTGKLDLLQEGLVHEVYSVEQEDQRQQMLQYSVKLASLESQLVAALQNQDGTLPVGVGAKTKELQKSLDVEIPAAQLFAAQTLLDADSTLANRQQESMTQKFDQAEQTFDEILQTIADELDKIPPEDPIASLLRDPTLDQILAQLENEQDFLEELGISRRPSNLRIMGDWSNYRGGMSSRLNQLQQRMGRLSNLAYRNAMNRARVKNPSNQPKLAKENQRWNLLVGQLGDDMLQGDKKNPPERYRAAIEHYSDQISKLKNAQAKE
ncbi:hypothetical protein LF1_27860 [Rubripirellula obstinata]|uniref:Uncharacterized protein n=1 Tax=Rubripirellula obstinata TaxID=406547 RepID=A0A5B1CGD2_9BACT|nr:hypothetical protein [Rubripirellula obstinata]KAA1260247.1 hypothetical protein LF1_27860 [Rubripirellula obstinata]